MWQRALENAETDGPDLDANAQPSTAEAPEGEQDPAIDVLGNEVAYDAVTALQVYEPRPRKQIRKYKSPKHPSLANPKRFPRPQEPEPIPQALGPIYLKHDDSFDDYDRGPTREEFIGPNTSLGDVDVLYGFDPVTEYLFPVSWTRFADQGMRLLTGYAHMHYMRKPWNIHAHVLPIAHLDYSLKDYYRTLHQADSHNEYMKAHRGHRRREEMEDFATSLFGVPSDVRFMGLGEMLSGAGRPGSAKNLDRFIRGRTSSGKLICLDIERDAVMVPPADVDVLMDIDSIIWVTSKVKVNMSINVATTPTVGKTPPIRKNNHVYVRVLQPPTHNERCDGMRDWAETATSLSIIPHTIFAKIVEGSCPINLIICFPRMLHRNSFTHKWEALIPFEIQRLFWDLVLLPALHECLGDADKPYVPVTVHNNQLKSASKEQKEGLLFRAKTASISPSVIWAMQDVMRRKVKEDPSLDLYGSFFFVIDAKNYKLQTRVPVSSSGEPQMSPWQALKAALPQLDLDYMADRSNGELTVDLAISFNPRKPTVPLVGLWRLDVLEASFGAGGYTRGSLHHIASLSRYGALQAPMGSERARQTHVVSRSSYNLQYEVIRASNNQPYFAEDGDAYEGHLIYRQECTRRVQIYRGECQQHTYGVRDEYRIGGEALQDFFTNWQDKTREFLESDPMVWIPSALWFEYLAVRVDELEYAQLRVNRQNPPNRGVLTSLLCHLIREVSSTDLIPAAHVRQSLALLQAQTVMNSFGALFLHTLNFDIEVIIPELQEFDDEAVLRSLKFSRGKPRRTRRQGPQQLNLPSVQYPLGPAPAWSEVMQAIDCDPTGFVDPFICPTWLDVNEVASRLFMQFTVQLYALLNDEWTLESTISPLDSLQDAMMFWTLEGMQKHLARVAFTATNGGLRGSIHGHKELSFRARASIFFPSFFDNNIRKGSQWHVFTGQMGYIRHYHSTLESCTEEEAADLHTALEDIFSYVQVLPFASAPTQDGHGTVWSRQGERVRIVVNPAYYKMDKIGSGPTKRRGGPQLTIGATKFLKKLAEGSRIGIPDIQALHRVHNNLRK
ncbi:hypothetical protein C8T65DRAFT_587481, partial [Cerioporus squamosus]